MKYYQVLKNRLLSSAHPNRVYFLCYTLLFILICSLIFSFIYMSDKSLVFRRDGVMQHVNSLAYYGKWLRDIARNILFEHKLQVPMWDMRIGYGADIITTFHYYAIGDPLNLFSIIVPFKNTDIFYQFLTIFRIFLSGCAFSAYALYHKNRRLPVLAGTFIFCFSEFVFSAALKHPFFLTPMIYFPLILIGIDKIFKKEKPHIFIISTAAMAISNFYFFYMSCIMMFIYAVFKYFIIIKKFSFKEIMTWMGKFIFFYTVGIMIAAVIFLPVVGEMLSASRISAKSGVPAFYEIQYYKNLLGGSLMGGPPNGQTVLGCTAVAVICILVLFIKRKEHKALFFGFLLLSTFLLLPYMGHAMNGFGYVTNRWSWSFIMLCAYIVVRMIPYMTELSSKEKKLLGISSISFIILCYLFQGDKIQIMRQLVIFSAGVGGIFFFRKNTSYKKYLPAFMLICVWTSLYINAQYRFSINGKNTVEIFIDQGKVMEKYNSQPSEAVKKVNDLDFWRYDQYDNSPETNNTIHQNFNSTAFYYSVVNENISRFHHEMAMPDQTNFYFTNLNSRSILERVFSAKYYLAPVKNTNPLPYAYSNTLMSKTKIKGTAYGIYADSHHLPLGYTYESYIPQKTWQNLLPIQKQAALLQGVALKESDYEQTDLAYNYQKPEYKIKLGKGATLSNNTLLTKKSNVPVTITFKGVPNSETYINFKNLRINEYSPFQLNTKSDFDIIVKTDDFERRMIMLNDRNSSYSGREDFMCNVGYHREGIQKITLLIKNRGRYTFDELSVICQPMTNIDAQTKLLRSEVLENVSMGINKVQGSIQLQKSKILCFSIPYSKGWHAYVDGKKSEIKQANTVFMALELNAGNHDIELVYRTPFLLPGIVLSFSGMLLLIVIVFFYRNKKQKITN